MAFGSGAVVNVGTIQTYGGNTAPDGWLICDGSAISRTLYAELFAVIGTTYGVGDGSTTFNIPNFIGLTSDNVPCCGNGITLGFSNGSQKGGLYEHVGAGCALALGNYGQNVGRASSGSDLTRGLTIGITTDTTKSGIISKLSSASQKSLAIIKY